MAKKDNLRAWGAASSGAGAAALAAAATACCVPVLAPLLVSVLGVSGAVWAAGLEPYSLAILAASGLLLGYGFRTVYRPRVAKAEDGGAGRACSVRRPVLVRWVLWLSAALWAMAAVINALQFLASR